MRKILSVLASVMYSAVESAAQVATKYYERYLYRVCLRALFFGVSVGVVLYTMVYFSFVLAVIGIAGAVVSFFELSKFTEHGIIAGRDVPRLLAVSVSGIVVSFGIILASKMALVELISSIASHVR